MGPFRALYALVALLAVLHSGGAAVRKKVRPPLVEEEGRRKLNKQTHCQFGNHTYELEERWRPDLGPPFGMLYCMRCECIPVQRKRRILSRVRCKNIKNDCPKPGCDDPVLLPQRCCKTCPGEDYADLEEDIATRKLESEDEEKILKEFTVLLTGKILVPPVLVPGAASGYLVYTKRDLHYTIHYKGISRPLAIRFTNEEGDILEEHEIPPAPHHSQGSKVCGVWRKVPKVYRRLLQKDKLIFVLSTADHPEGIVGGRVMKHNAINTGTLFVLDTKKSPLLMSDIIVDLKNDFNSVTVKLDLQPYLQERLSTGQFELRISSRDGMRIQSGRIMPKVTCNVFQAVMTPTEVTDVTKDPVTGFIILDIGSDGYIHYKMHVSDPNIETVTIRLETDVETPSGTGMRVLQQVTQNLTDSWGNGSFGRRSSQEVEMMLSDDLVVSVYAEAIPLPANSFLHRTVPDDAVRSRTTRSEKIRMELRGQVRQRLYTDALLNEMPILLLGENSTAGGIAWLSVDKDCVLHYQVYVAGLDPRERHLLELQQVRPGKYSADIQRVLKRFEGEQVEDVADDLDGRSLAYLHAGYTYLMVTSKLSGKAKAMQLRAKITELYTPPSCLPRYDMTTLHKSGGGHTYQDGYNDVYGGANDHQCIYADALFEDGSYWRAEHEECTMCSCQRGNVVCEKTVCPEPTCESPITMPGVCCPFCPGNSSVGEHREAQRFCYFGQGDQKYHPAGSRWHPYVPPFGFSKCSLCFCEPKTLAVKCERITCPPLTCPDKESYRENSNACCKKCPASVSVKAGIIVPPSKGQLGDQGGEKMIEKEILANGGCKYRGQPYRNGDEWHPTIDPYGIEKCVKCHCKDGRAKCKRKKCPKETCPVKVQGDDGCCERCIDTASSESSSRSSEGKVKKRRKERERRHRKTRQPKEKNQH
ncbi:dorsal-ventral patterning protein Sog [Nephila pilipes]|uniref:Dorsal-ventral patterning protein Sog n=1 Tax=Nephila pilipes TaxID=299642 RepID=A0A8X6MMA2_NEPPI|nr:dorsal-ventral patterning protein Sog [Nephila pilipes]